MTTKCLLFAYGLLQPGLKPPRSLSQSWPDRVRGQLYDLGPYPVAVGLDVGSAWLEGFTLEIDADELGALDEFEDVDSGEFARRVVTTGRGFTAWAYEYRRALPAHQPAIKKWPLP